MQSSLLWCQWDKNHCDTLIKTLVWVLFPWGAFPLWADLVACVPCLHSLPPCPKCDPMEGKWWQMLLWALRFLAFSSTKGHSSERIQLVIHQFWSVWLDQHHYPRFLIVRRLEETSPRKGVIHTRSGMSVFPDEKLL